MIKEHYDRGRFQISRLLCEAWNWRQTGGALKDCACRDLLLRLEERGFIQLPPRKRNTGGCHKGVGHLPLPLTPHPIESGDLSQVRVDLVTSREDRISWRILMENFHYLGDRVIPGEHLLYFVRLDGEIVGCLSWSAAALHCPSRDNYIGWDFETKRHRLHFVANNQRFLILPWVKIKRLGSRILGLNLRRLSLDWRQKYNHPLALVETFVDVAKFEGTVYRATNWMYVGMTGGRKKKGHRYEHQWVPKAIYLYPLHRRFRQILVGEEK